MFAGVWYRFDASPPIASYRHGRIPPRGPCGAGVDMRATTCFCNACWVVFPAPRCYYGSMGRIPGVAMLLPGVTKANDSFSYPRRCFCRRRWRLLRRAGMLATLSLPTPIWSHRRMSSLDTTIGRFLDVILGQLGVKE